MSNVNAHLAMILGAAIAGLIANGQTPEDVKDLVEHALATARALADNPELARPMHDAMTDLAEAIHDA